MTADIDSGNATKTPKKITGWTVFTIFAGCFGIIILANLALVYAAVGSWPGLEAKNTYVEALGFDDRQKAQAALNWVVETDYEDGDVVLEFTDGTGKPVYLQSLNVIVGLATKDAVDQTVAVSQFRRSYRGTVDLTPGNWQVRIAAVGLDGEPFRQRLSLIVR